jgi:hypothetical protein
MNVLSTTLYYINKPLMYFVFIVERHLQFITLV